MGRVKKQDNWSKDGEEDKLVAKYIKEGKITKNTKPSDLVALNPKKFNRFSTAVIRNHLNELKRLHGTYLVEDAGTSNERVDEDASDSTDENIPCDKSSAVVNTQQGIDIDQYPYFCGTFKNVEDEVDMVVAGISIPGGAKNVTIDLNTNGLEIMVKFDWPKTLFDANDLFNKELATGMQVYHPMIQSFKNELQNVRNSIDSAPQTMITIPLPMRVETSPTSWKKEGIARKDGTQVIKAVFKGFVTAYNKKFLDNKVNFNN